MTDKVLVTVTLPHGATLEDACRELGLDLNEVDTEYGLVPIDPDKGKYALRVTAAAGTRIGGAYADPRIEPYGPPQT